MSSPIAPKVRVGLIGAGYVAAHHLRALNALPFVEVVGICDRDRSRAEALARKIPRRCGLFGPFFNGWGEARGNSHSHPARIALLASARCHGPGLPRLRREADGGVGRRMRPHDRTRAREGCGAVDQSLGSFRPGRLAGDPDRAFRCHRRRAGGALDSQLGLSDLRGRTAPAAVSTRVVSVSRPRRAQPVLGRELRRAGAERSWSATTSRVATPCSPSTNGAPTPECERGTGSMYLSWNTRPIQSELEIHGTRGVIKVDRFLQVCDVNRVLPGPKQIGNILNGFRNAVRRSFIVPFNLLRFMTGFAQAFAGHLPLCAGFPHRVPQRLGRYRYRPKRAAAWRSGSTSRAATPTTRRRSVSRTS